MYSGKEFEILANRTTSTFQKCVRTFRLFLRRLFTVKIVAPVVEKVHIFLNCPLDELK